MIEFKCAATKTFAADVASYLFYNFYLKNTFPHYKLYSQFENIVLKIYGTDSIIYCTSNLANKQIC